jgi:hypothetical protein
MTKRQYYEIYGVGLVKRPTMLAGASACPFNCASHEQYRWQRQRQQTTSP